MNICRIFGHKYAQHFMVDLGADRPCTRKNCNHIEPGLKWPRPPEKPPVKIYRVVCCIGCRKNSIVEIKND